MSSKNKTCQSWNTTVFEDLYHEENFCRFLQDDVPMCAETTNKVKGGNSYKLEACDIEPCGEYSSIVVRQGIN